MVRAGLCAIALVLAPLGARAELAAEDALELVQIMAGLPVTRHNGSLAEMQGRAELFARLQAGAETGDTEMLSAFLLYGQIALVRADGATAGSFIAAMKPLYDARSAEILAALEAAPWLTGSTCHLIGRYFGWEDRNSDVRDPFLEAETPRINAALSEPLAAGCIAQITDPARPGG